MSAKQTMDFPCGTVVNNPTAKIRDLRDMGLDKFGVGKIHWRQGNDNLLQYSCLENSRTKPDGLRLLGWQVVKHTLHPTK